MLTNNINTLIALANEKQYSFTGEDIAVISYALGVAGVTRLLDENNQLTREASYALVQFDKANPLQWHDTAFETLVDLGVATWPEHYSQNNVEETTEETDDSMNDDSANNPVI